ncbi:MAG: site-specific integrase [Zoogloea sp.]|nr:site-specific integrase [Zoogloea sp.]
MQNTLPSLTFPMVEFGPKQTPWTLDFILYKGGSEVKANRLSHHIANNDLGNPLTDRFTLAIKVHEELVACLVGGGSIQTVNSRIAALRTFFSWVDITDTPIHLEKVADVYLKWAAHLEQRQRIDGRPTKITLHSWASHLAAILNPVLGRKHSILKETRIRKPKSAKRFNTSAASKVDLSAMFRFGHLVTDLCISLSTSSIKGNLPLVLELRSGQIELWSGLSKPTRAQPRTTIRHNREKKISAEKRTAWIEDKSLRTRGPLVNLRIEAELLMFIAQTGMNLQQAYSLRLDNYRYASHLDGYQVLSYKARREGTVLFEIFGEYRAHFENYLRWRNDWFGDLDDERLFPLILAGRIHWRPPEFSQVRRIAKTLAVPYFSPRILRKGRVNWLLRQMASPDAVAEIAQHDVETLIRNYAEPHPQVAMVEISRFHERNDPSFVPPGPGCCVNPVPRAEEQLPAGTPAPDCTSGAGCLFCNNHRDIDSSDHIWSLASFRHLKSIELARHRPPEGKSASIEAHPALAVVTRVTHKLQFLESSSEVRGAWVKEALFRIEEGAYHPAWDGLIQINEMGIVI